MTPLEKELLDALIQIIRILESYDCKLRVTDNDLLVANVRMTAIQSVQKAESQSTPLPTDIDLDELERALMRDKGLENFRPIYTNIIVDAARLYLQTTKAPLPEGVMTDDLVKAIADFQKYEDAKDFSELDWGESNYYAGIFFKAVKLLAKPITDDASNLVQLLNITGCRKTTDAQQGRMIMSELTRADFEKVLDDWNAVLIRMPHLQNSITLGAIRTALQRAASSPSMEAAESMGEVRSGWFKLDENIPETGKFPPPPNTIILLWDGEFITAGEYKSDENYPACYWTHEIDGDFYPTHWMPLPAAPVIKPEGTV